MVAESDLIAGDVLKQWIDSGVFEPLHLRGEGRRLVGTIAHVASGVLDLLNKDPAMILQRLVVPAYKDSYPSDSAFDSDSGMVVVYNPKPLRCGCEPPPHSDEFARGGTLELHAVTLEAQANNAKENRLARMGIVFTAPEDNATGYSVLTVRNDGAVEGHHFAPQLKANDAARGALGDPTAMLHLVKTSGGDIEYTLRFTGGLKYFEEALPRLGAYYSALASMLARDHKHQH